MTTTHADLRDGSRYDIAVEFVTRRSLDCAGRCVHRLVVADRTGTQFPVLVTPDRDPLLDLKTGATYQVEGLLGAAPVADARSANDGTTSRGRAIATAGPAVGRAAARLGLDRRFGIIDARTVVSTTPDRAGSETGGD